MTASSTYSSDSTVLETFIELGLQHHKPSYGSVYEKSGNLGGWGGGGGALNPLCSISYGYIEVQQPQYSAQTTSVASGAVTTFSPKKTSRPKKTKTHWDETEKDLFHKGMELFGPNWKKIANFITTKTPGQVRSFHKKWAETANVIQESESLDSTYVFVQDDSMADQICISTGLEDPQGLIETATTTVSTTPLSPKRIRALSKKTRTSSESDTDVGVFNSTEEIFVPSVAEEWIIESQDVDLESKERLNHYKKVKTFVKKQNENRKKVKKKKTKNKAAPQIPFKMKPLKSKHKPPKKEKLKLTIKHTNGQYNFQKNSKICYYKKNAIRDGQYRNINNIVAPPVIEGQVVHITKDDEEESDVDIDISDDEQLMIVDGVSDDEGNNDKKGDIIESKEKNIKEDPEGDSFSTGSCMSGSENDISSQCKQHVFTFSVPTEEKFFDTNQITEEERRVHFEYFDGKGVKTPERYLKIRNYLVNFWNQIKPNYVRKTAVRTGLKNCGDVNSIGKVHEYLEKVGAINFGCPESVYDTPLITGTRTREKPQSQTKSQSKIDRSEMARQKQKNKKWEASLNEGGGLTISHDESGAVVDAFHIPEAPRNRGSGNNGKGSGRLEQFKLVRCLDYDPDTPAPYSVIMHAHAIITMDLHAHTSVAEVMGLLGGYYDPAMDTIHVTVAVPTKATTSGVECDMCPVSQSSACTKIHEGGVQVVGWYHSHPTFPPNPSVQDIETQSQMQRWFARQEAPFLGVIVSPFCPTNRGEASQIRCIVLDAPPHCSSDSDSETKVPYKLNWSTSEAMPGLWEEVCESVRGVVGSARDDPMAVDWRREWRGQTTNWEKAIASLAHHLPQHLAAPLEIVRACFLTAVREYMDS
ncbi:unnamed protein product, partial [Meganyctiphanes norvegica]